MENFFVDENYYSDLDDFLIDHEIYDKEGVQLLDDNWQQKIELSKLEKIFVIDKKWIVEQIYNCNEDRFPENPEIIDNKISEAISSSVDFTKLNSLLPELYYPSGEFEVLTKKHLLDYLTD